MTELYKQVEVGNFTEGQQPRKETLSQYPMTKLLQAAEHRGLPPWQIPVHGGGLIVSSQINAANQTWHCNVTKAIEKENHAVNPSALIHTS